MLEGIFQLHIHMLSGWALTQQPPPCRPKHEAPAAPLKACLLQTTRGRQWQSSGPAAINCPTDRHQGTERKKKHKKNQHNKAVKIQDYLDWMLWALTAFLQGNHWFFLLLFLFICLGHQTGCQLHKQKLVVHYKWTLDHFPEDLPQDSRWFWFSFGHRMLPKISIFPEPFIFYKE